MGANQFKVNSDKTNLPIICQSGGGEAQKRVVAERRAAETLTTGGEPIVQSDSELLLWSTFHYSVCMGMEL